MRKYRLQSKPEERVKDFISDWYSQLVVANKKMGKEISFKIWKKMVSEVDKLHFVTDRGSGTGNHFCSDAEFNPKIEKVDLPRFSGPFF